MAMSTGSGSGGLQSEINITPLVDVVLVLLIIFMVVVPLLMEGYDVEIPRAAAAMPSQAEELQLVLNITPAACGITLPLQGDGVPADCRVTLGDQKIAASELPGHIAAILGGQPPEKRVLFLAADDRLNYEGVLRIVDLAKSGVKDLKIEFVAIN